MRTADDLGQTLRRIDGRGYKAYKQIAGAYRLRSDLGLFIDHVQGDPFAAPSRLRLRLDWHAAAFPEWALTHESRRIALRDFLTRAFGAAIETRGRTVLGSGKSGLVAIDVPGQEVLERTSVMLLPDAVEARFVVGLPARGRTVLGRQAERLLLVELPRLADRSLAFAALDARALECQLDCVEDQAALRAQLASRGLLAFIGDGAVLPRASGVDPRPMKGQVVPFESPESLAMELEAPHAGKIRGMGVGEGVSLIVGGGYHGKSTLLRALEMGIYDHIPGDGREQVVTRSEAVKIRAEDGRRVERVDLRPFIRNLPFGRDTSAFCTDDASGSTSQAANILEALEAGAGVLLMDEDTSATNFMIRDHRMQALVAKDREPITPFIDRARQLYTEWGVSTVLVIGGAGDYFDIADRVILMDAYLPREVTAEARRIAERFQGLRQSEAAGDCGTAAPRKVDPASLDPSRGRRDVKVEPRGIHTLLFGRQEIDLGALEQLVDVSQTRTLGRALVYMKERLFDGRHSLAEALDLLQEALDREGLDLLARGRDGGLASVRRYEIAAALGRLRSLRIR